MKLLLDTHVWLWQLLAPENLSPRAAKLLDDPDVDLYLSPISVWETLVLARKGKLELRPDPISWIHDALARSPVSMEPLTHDIAIAAESMPGFPVQDPGDRFLAATCLVGGHSLLTGDRRLLEHASLPTVW